MSMPIICTPPILNNLFNPYRHFFTKPQFKHFKNLVTGLIVSENKTIQEINDSFGQKDQSSLNRFVSHSSWDLDKLNLLRLENTKNCLSLKKKGAIIIDESLLHKTGEKMELAGFHRSGITKNIEWGHMAVNAFYTDSDNNDFPVKTDVYVREQDCKKYNVSFKTKREIAIEQIDHALEAKLPIRLVLVDAGYEGEEFTREIKDRLLDFIIGVRTSTNISVDRQKRISIGDYLSNLTDDNFKFYLTEEKAYFYHIKEVSIRGIGKVKLVISYMCGDEENIKCYITNLSEENEIIIKLLIKRWRIECFHRDAKQHLGLEAYQVRKGRGMQVVALAILTAYTLVILAARILKTPIRSLRTVGEVCRYLQLIAYKGIKWVKSKLKDAMKWVRILKKHVFVKTAKV
ncbi:MAG: IS701 family transposase [Nanoarchaeota archaeon]|nr:IS701 family transposase [Nanoarchaeota archaeon]